MSTYRWSKRMLYTIGALSLVAVLAGCGGGLKGNWSGDKLSPEMARDEFKFLVPASTPGKLAKADLNLQKDRTFSASVVYGTQVYPVSGTWEWKKPKLVLRDNRGEAYIYMARKDDDRLRITQGIDGTDVTLELEKE